MRTLGPPLARGLRALPAGRRVERFLLEHIWSNARAEMLDSYLVSGFQNPRINLQSILLRHHLIRRLGVADEPLMEAEIRFAIDLNEVLRRRAQQLGVKMGAYLDPEKAAGVRRVDAAIADRQDEFTDRWRAMLAGRSGPKLSVLELACGSANDYRAFVAVGLAPHLDYRGIDLTAKNIDNARRRFPDVAFEVGDIVDVAHPDRSASCVIASDILEHLSLESMEHALDEACRLTRDSLVLTFFNMGDGDQHERQPRGTYHWNLLSRPLVEARLRREFARVTVTPIAAWLRERYGATRTYNPRAVTMIAER
jgi:ubiquinone/menaquinone biosynthesis C-methylase UbiE